MNKKICLDHCKTMWVEKEGTRGYFCPWVDIAGDTGGDALTDEEWRTKLKPPSFCPFAVDHIMKDNDEATKETTSD